ncbi:MAG: zinc-ribbon domain-containing protein [Ruminococcus sp.]|nr:zinc-ribbon domain-containing protein [Ruminococcus sp.]
MAKFCPSCGFQMQDDMGFCPNCGAPQQAQQQAPQQQFQQPQQQFQQPNNGMPQMGYGAQPGMAGVVAGKKLKLPDKKILMLGGIALAGIIVLIIIFSLIFGSKYSDPLDDYVKALENGDGKAYQHSVFEVDSPLFDKKSTLEYAEEAKELHEDFVDDFGPGAKCTYEILEKTKMDSTDLAKANSILSIVNIKIKDAYKLRVAFSYKGPDDTKTDKQTVVVLKTSDGWKFNMETEPDDIYAY